MSGWKEIARQFAARIRALPLDEKAVAFLKQIPADRPILVACSGGADSVFLALSLLGLLGNPDRLHIVHFNHGVRGADADADADFVADLSARLDIGLSIGKPDSPLKAEESRLREARYAWMLGIYRSLNAGALCLGHHADDLLESQLMALFSGTGPSGLASPAPVRCFIDGHYRVRPLVRIRRAQIEQVLHETGAQWREDASNADRRFTRNRIRHEVIPLLQKQLPQDIFSGSALTRQWMEEVLEVIDESLADLKLDSGNPGFLDLRQLRGRPQGLARRAILAWWLRHQGPETLPKDALQAILDRLRMGRAEEPVSIGGGRVLEIDADDRLVLRPETSPPPQAWVAGASWHWPAGPLFLPTGATLQADTVRFSPSGKPPFAGADPSHEAWLATDEPAFAVRQWMPGDRYRPLGAPGSRKLQDLFVDAKLKSEQKHRLPVIMDRRGSILWVPGFPPCEQLRVPPQAKTALKLTYQPHSSGLPLEYGRQTQSTA